MRATDLLTGKPSDRREPHWQPLLNFLAGPFMWMFEVKCKDGRTLQAYKHSRTRRYLHIDEDCNVFVFVDKDRYQQVEPDWLLAEVLQLECRSDTETSDELY